MWFEIFNWLGNAYGAFRAAQDAGIWFTQIDAKIFENFMESSLVKKGLL